MTNTALGALYPMKKRPNTKRKAVLVVHLIDSDKLLAHVATWAKHPDLLVGSVAEGLRTRIQAGEFDYTPDPIAVANAEQSEYYRTHPIENDAGTGQENDELEGEEE